MTNIRRVDTARGHKYVDDAGVRIPGVTTIIGNGIPKPALINWAANVTAEAAVDQWDDLSKLPPSVRLKTLQGVRYADKDRAAKRGTEVHQAAEHLLAGEPVSVPEEIRGHVEAYAQFLTDFTVNPLLTEFSAYSVRWRYAGTADLCAELTIGGERVVCIIDLKTSRSGIFGETALQLAAYRFAEWWVRPDGSVIKPLACDMALGLHVRSDGYDLMPITADEAQHKAFLYAQMVARWCDESRDLVGPPLDPTGRSKFRLTQVGEC